MKLINFINRNNIKCRTCKQTIDIKDLNLHIAHDVRIVDKPKWFFIDVFTTAFMFSAVLGVIVWALWDGFMKLLQTCMDKGINPI